MLSASQSMLHAVYFDSAILLKFVFSISTLSLCDLNTVPCSLYDICKLPRLSLLFELQDFFPRGMT